MSETTPETLHICGYGKKLKKHNDMLVVEWKDNGEARALSFTSSRLRHVILSGEHLISTGAIRLLFENGVALSYMDRFGNPVGYIFPHGKGRHVDTWEKQLLLGKERSLEIARSMCKAAGENKISVLLSLQKSRGVDMGESVSDMRRIVANMDGAKNSNELMGFEGRVSRLYFSSFANVLPPDLGFAGRIKHPSPDIVNVMLSYGYGILYSKIRHAVVAANLNPYRGVLHASYRDQEALVYDLIEEFRQPVVDKVVLTMVGKKQVSDNDHVLEGRVCLMKDHFKREFANKVFERLESETKYEDGRRTFEDIIVEQAKKFRACVVEGVQYVPFIFRSR
ncbi:CRISPR-associated endonuclease Cas1 [Methanomethylovorans sp.]|uniref:CRISPR-associated endonuclease Cas1 n=1 Tax=Methanomethylovorans sp. TaxID=2758717 RepID=UPI00345F118C